MEFWLTVNYSSYSRRQGKVFNRRIEQLLLMNHNTYQLQLLSPPPKQTVINLPNISLRLTMHKKQIAIKYARVITAPI